MQRGSRHRDARLQAVLDESLLGGRVVDGSAISLATQHESRDQILGYLALRHHFIHARHRATAHALTQERWSPDAYDVERSLIAASPQDLDTA